MVVKRIVLCLSHAIEEYDQLRLLHGLGYEVFSIGGYVDPAHPHDPKRPGLDIPFYPELRDAVDAAGGPGMDNLGLAQARIPDEILDWLGDDGVIIYHHYLERLYGQWDRIADWKRGSSGRRVVWRTVGQSVEHNERTAQPYRSEGLEIVRYSPKERNIPGYAGEDTLIRFYKDPADWPSWRGQSKVVLNITQHLKARDPYTNYRFWVPTTEGLPVKTVGPGSEEIGGAGELFVEEMAALLALCRCYLYTGTQPASYTLGLIEAMMTGIPVVSIGPSWMDVFPYGPELFEGHEICGLFYGDPEHARMKLQNLLDDHDEAAEIGRVQHERALGLFSPDVVGAGWREFLGAP